MPPSEASAPGSIGKNRPVSRRWLLSAVRVTPASTRQSRSSALTSSTRLMPERSIGDAALDRREVAFERRAGAEGDHRRAVAGANRARSPPPPRWRRRRPPRRADGPRDRSRPCRAARAPPPRWKAARRSAPGISAIASRRIGARLGQGRRRSSRYSPSGCRIGACQNMTLRYHATRFTLNTPVDRRRGTAARPNHGKVMPYLLTDVVPTPRDRPHAGLEPR